MLVALPASIAFGVTVYMAISPGYAALGALAGIIGATVIGLAAGTLGGTDRLISAPCAPAAAVLSAFAVELAGQGMAPETLAQLHEMELFSHHRDETLQDLEARMEQRYYKAGDTIYSRGEEGREIYWIRRGEVRIFAPLGAGRSRHIASFGRGDFFGGLAFLDGGARSDEAIVLTDTEVYVLTRETFYRLSEEHKKLAFNLILAIARSLAIRLRHADSEMAMLREY